MLKSIVSYPEYVRQSPEVCECIKSKIPQTAAHLHTYIHTYIHTYTHTHIHTHSFLEKNHYKQFKFAMDAFSAFEARNYCRFFKLARSTTYLNACAMHRRFFEIRFHALNVLQTAQAVRDKVVPFPTDEIVKLLAFDSTEVAAEYMSALGLLVAQVCDNCANT